MVFKKDVIFHKFDFETSEIIIIIMIIIIIIIRNVYIANSAQSA